MSFNARNKFLKHRILFTVSINYEKLGQRFPTFAKLIYCQQIIKVNLIFYSKLNYFIFSCAEILNLHPINGDYVRNLHKCPYFRHEDDLCRKMGVEHYYAPIIITFYHVL